jgi:hypothetical protein
MRGLLSALADGRGGWLTSWYARAHLRRCPKCTAAMRALLALKQGLSGFGTVTMGLGEGRWAEIEAACRERDQE